MKQLVAAVFTLTAIVAGIVLATSLSSSAQEDGGPGDTTTTTVPDDSEFSGRFGFHFGGELPPEIDDLLECLSTHGIAVPEDVDRSFMFDLRSEDIEGLAEALEDCGLPSFGDRFSGGLPFDGEFPEGFSEDHFPEGFPFGDGGFGFDFRGPGLDLDELAGCLAELGSFDSVDQVRGKLDECLPALADLDGSDLDRFGDRGRRGHGFPFGGHGPFGFEFDDDAPALEGTST